MIDRWIFHGYVSLQVGILNVDIDRQSESLG